MLPQRRGFESRPPALEDGLRQPWRFQDEHAMEDRQEQAWRQRMLQYPALEDRQAQYEPGFQQTDSRQQNYVFQDGFVQRPQFASDSAQWPRQAVQDWRLHQTAPQFQDWRLHQTAAPQFQDWRLHQAAAAPQFQLRFQDGQGAGFPQDQGQRRLQYFPDHLQPVFPSQYELADEGCSKRQRMLPPTLPGGTAQGIAPGETGEGTVELLRRSGLDGSEGGRKVFFEDSSSLLPVPASVNDTVKLWKWLENMQPGGEVRNLKQIWEPFPQPAVHMKLPGSFVVRVRCRHDPQSVVPYCSRQQQLGYSSQLVVPRCSRHLGCTETALANSAFVSVDVEECPELLVWTEQVVKMNVPRRTVDIDSVLVPLRPLVAEFRHLHFLLFEGRSKSLDEVLKMRSSRNKGQNDLELPYPPLLACFCRAAASGQPEVNFFAEAHQETGREDICVQVNGVSQPSEVKAAFYKALAGDPASGIDRNKAAFSKMLQCNGEDEPQRRWHLGLFAARIERLWFALFEYTEAGTLESITVAPEFPVSNVWDNRNRLFDIRQLDKANLARKSLLDVVAVSPEPGFLLLVRYVDTLCSKMGIPVSEIELITDETGEALDLTQAAVVAQGFKSLVLKIGEDVSKVSKASLIDHEHAMHAAVDEVAFVRPMVKGQFGFVRGAGEDLRWFALRGFGRHMRAEDVRDNYEELWRCGEAAVCGIHEKGVFHRDIKPSNFLIIDGVLELNDFDASCFVGDSPEVLRQRVGTPWFASPFLEANQAYQYRDDWCSLVLTFLSLGRVYTPGDNKKSAMEQALQNKDVPSMVKACITWIYSPAAANGGLRQQLTNLKQPPRSSRRW